VHNEDHTREREEKAEKRRAKEARSGEAAEARRRRQEEFLRDEARRQNAERERQRHKNSKESHRQRTENARERKREKADRNRRQGQKNKNSANTKTGTVEPGARISDAQRQAWTKACNLFFADKEGKTPFPQPPSSKGCRKSKCVGGEILGVCNHEIGGLLLLDKAHLRKERLRWHPDKFSGAGQNQAKAQEMFQLIQRLIDGNSL
jgi:hypothetical protein